MVEPEYIGVEEPKPIDLGLRADLHPEEQEAFLAWRGAEAKQHTADARARKEAEEFGFTAKLPQDDDFHVGGRHVSEPPLFIEDPSWDDALFKDGVAVRERYAAEQRQRAEEVERKKAARPGVSPEMLAKFNVRRVDANEAEKLTGHAKPGFAIPYFNSLCGLLRLTDAKGDEREFWRLRVDTEFVVGKNKYLAPFGTTPQLYVPPTQRKHDVFVLVEGEFKTLSLVESGVPATVAGVGGISSFWKRDEKTGERHLLPRIVEEIKATGSQVIAFLGDSDTAMNFQFSNEAVKLRKALDKLGLEVRLVLPRLPFNGPKGIDDVREERGESFGDFWEKIMTEAVEVFPNTESGDLALRLLQPDWPDIVADFREGSKTHWPRLKKLGTDLIGRAPTDFGTLSALVKEKLGVGMVSFKDEVTALKKERDKERALQERAHSAPVDDSPLAQKLSERFRSYFRWVSGWGWVHFNSGRWEKVPDAIIVEATRIALSNEFELHVARGTVTRATPRLLSTKKIEDVVTLLQGLLSARGSDFDSHLDLLNVGNGVVDLCTGELLPHDPELFFTAITEVEYKPDASHPDWDKALEALPAESREWFQVRIGQAFTGHMTPDDIIPFLHGGGSNGKSCITTAILNAGGEHARIAPERLLLTDTSAHPTELMTLQGARFVLVEELPEGARLTKRIKDIAGTAYITARHCGKDNVTFPATHSSFVTTNHEPNVANTDHGTWRRLVLVPFPYRFVKAGEPLEGPEYRHGDAGLRERLKHGGGGRWEAVLAWIVAGSVKWFADGMLPLPEGVRSATTDWRGDCDSILSYAEDHLEPHESSFVLGGELYEHFADWLREHGQGVLSAKEFKRRFASHDWTIKHKVAQARARVPRTGLSKAPGLFRAKSVDGTTQRFWRGVRFRTGEA